MSYGPLVGVGKLVDCGAPFLLGRSMMTSKTVSEAISEAARLFLSQELFEFDEEKLDELVFELTELVRKRVFQVNVE